MFKGFKKNCRDECVKNMKEITNRMQTDMEYFQIAVEKEDTESIKKWIRVLDKDMGNYSSNLKVYRWFL